MKPLKRLWNLTPLLLRIPLMPFMFFKILFFDIKVHNLPTPEDIIFSYGDLVEGRDPPITLPPGGILLLGPVGTGRSFLAEALARECGFSLGHRQPEPNQASQEARERAWELLQEFLTEEQKEQADGSFVIEQGQFGSYRIPLHRGPVHCNLTADKEKFFELSRFVLQLKHPNSFPAKPPATCSLCFSNTGFDVNAPWHDAVLTLLLHIRAGHEKELWRKAGITVNETRGDPGGFMPLYITGVRI